MNVKGNITLSNIEIENPRNAIYSLDMDNTAFEKQLSMEYEVVNGVRTPKFITKIVPEAIDLKVTKFENNETVLLTSDKYGFFLECNEYYIDETTFQITAVKKNNYKQIISEILNPLIYGNTGHSHIYMYQYVSNPDFSTDTYYTLIGQQVDLTEDTYLKNTYYIYQNDIYILQNDDFDDSKQYYAVIGNQAISKESGIKYYKNINNQILPYLLPWNIQNYLDQPNFNAYYKWDFYIQDIFEDSEIVKINDTYNYKGLVNLSNNLYYNNLSALYSLLGQISEESFNNYKSMGLKLYKKQDNNYIEVLEWDIAVNVYYTQANTEFLSEKEKFYNDLKTIYKNIGNSLRENNADFKFSFILNENENQELYGPYYASICWASNDVAAKLTIDKYDITAAVTNNYLSFNKQGLSLYSTGVDGAGGLTIYKGNEAVFWADNDGNLHLRGDISADSGYFSGEVEATSGTFNGEVYATNGVFNGTVYANNGTFKGTINAESGEIGGIKITDGGLEHIPTLLGQEPQFKINKDGSIIAKNIELGAAATISDYIKLGNGYIYNPNKYNQKFIEVINNNLTSLLINDDGTGTLGNIHFNGNTSIIEGYNNDFKAWELNPNTSIFNNVNISGTLTTAIFETQKTQLVGSTFLFKTGIEFEDKEITDLSSGSAFTIITKYGDTPLNNYLYKITDNAHNNEFYAKYDETYNRFIALESTSGTQIYNLAIEMGEITGNGASETIEDWLIGINSTRNTGNGLYPNGITISEIIKDSELGFTTIPRILLGDLSSIGQNTYGLYADSVYLTGTLTTKYSTDSGIGYAGINTLSGVRFNKTIPGLTADNSPIVIWAGAEGTEATNIQDAKFQITDNGTLYATQGYFAGTIITDATIQASELTVDKIYGSKTAVDDDGNSIGLRIQDADVGIEFYTPDGLLAFKISEDSAFFNVPLEFGNKITGTIFENAAGSFNQIIVRDTESVPGTIYITPEFIYLNNSYTNDSLLDSIPYRVGNINNSIQLQHNSNTILNIDDDNAQIIPKITSSIGLAIGQFTSPSAEYRIAEDGGVGIDLYIY